MPVNDPPTVVGLGELIWDCFEDSRRPGGATANVAFHVQQLGCRGVVCSRAGADALGDEFVQFLTSQGLDTSYVQRDQRRPTSTSTVDTSQPGHPEFIIHEDVAWDALEFDEPTRELMQKADAVCFGSLAQRAALSRATIHRCLEATRDECLLVYDVNLRQEFFDRELILVSLERADVLKLNGAEVAVLSPLLEVGANSLTGFARAVCARFDIGMCCITQAEQGCLVITEAETIDVPGIEVEVSDAVGAGDAFTAALIYARLKNWPLSTTARFANEVGSLVASRPGAMPPVSDEFEALIAKFVP